jgi:hypothetical protein
MRYQQMIPRSVDTIFLMADPGYVRCIVLVQYALLRHSGLSLSRCSPGA